ncbi:MAG TPA: ATP-binding protein, partial [Blastocatellia bacterium]|nr:ATP-binding protein [Blastocatellia bacterium]
ARDERVISRLDVIAGQIERITNIVRSMLDSTRRPVPQLVAVDVNSLLAQILDATQPTLASRNVEVHTEMSDALPPIQADPDQLQQVFINLINNSLDAMPLGGKLSVSTAPGANSVVIVLADSGEGIARDEIDVIFDPLFSTKHGRGTGLGLTIVKQIITEHGGEVEVESEPGHQTTFRITLPLSATRFRDNENSGASTAGGEPNSDSIDGLDPAAEDSALVTE